MATKGSSDTKSTRDGGDNEESESVVANKRSRSSIDGSASSTLGLTTKINYPKKRVSVACEICRWRKTKCDAKKPACTFCAQIGADCVYRKATASNRSDQPDEEENLGPEILSRLERIEKILNNPLYADNHASPMSQGISTSSFISTPRSPVDHVPPPPPPPPPSSSNDSHSRSSGPALIIGLSLVGLTRLPGQDPIPALNPLIGDGQEYLLQEIRQSEALLEAKQVNFEDLDLNGTYCWRLQKSFVDHVLPWFPIFDQQDCSDLITRTLGPRRDEINLETSLMLLILALGSFARDDQHMDDDPAHFPGINYFLVAHHIVRHNWAQKFTLLGVQCHILISFYCLFTLRPFQAFESIHQASTAVIALLQMTDRLKTDSVFRESCHRAYWTCYLIEHELQAHVSYSSRTLDEVNQHVPLPAPTSLDNQSRFFWFSSEIAIRRIFTESHDRSGWNASTNYLRPVVEELGFQINQWYSRLPPSLRFPHTTEPIYEPQMAFLRAQYYCCFTVIYWPFVLRMLAGPQQDPEEHAKTVIGGARSLECGVMAVITIESLLQSRHIFLLVDMMGIYCVIMLLACTYNVPEVAEIQHPFQVQAVQKGREMCAVWMANPLIAGLITKIDKVMHERGIPIDPMARADPTSLMLTSRVPPFPPSAPVLPQHRHTPSDPGLVADVMTLDTSRSSSGVVSPEHIHDSLSYQPYQQQSKRPRIVQESPSAPNSFS